MAAMFILPRYNAMNRGVAMQGTVSRALSHATLAGQALDAAALLQ